MLDLLWHWGDWNVPYIHRDIGTRDEFDYYLRKWAQRQADRFPILYLATHGDSGEITFGDWRRSRNHVTLDQIAEQLEDRCHGRIVHFGACEVLATRSRDIRRFLNKTGLLAVSGYQSQVEWFDGTILDATIFASMQRNALTRPGAQAMHRAILASVGGLAKRLQFRMMVADS